MNISALDPRDGGPPNAVLRTATELSKRGHQVHVVATRIRDSDLPPAYDSAVRSGVQIHLATRRRWGKMKISVGHLRRAIQISRDADLVSIHGFYQAVAIAGYLASSLHRQRRPVFLVQPHGVFETYQEAFSRRPKRLYMSVIGRRIIRRADVIAAASQAEAHHVATTLGPGVRVNVTGLGVHLTANAETARTNGTVLRDPRTVLFLSRIAPKKRLDLLIGACALLADDGRPFELLVAGDGDPAYVDQLRSQAEGLPVHFFGHVSGLSRHDLEDRASLFVLPSENENFGQAVTEAMGAGLAVITTDQVGASEHVEAADSGWVLSDVTAASLGDAIDLALSDEQRLDEFGDRARRYAEAHLGWSAVAAAWEAAYDAASGAAHR